MDTKIIESSDANVKKYVFTWDNAVAESVLYKYPTYDKRTVICCSTQSGCPIGCRFCGAGDYFVRSLTAEEIVSQPVKLLEDTGVDPNAIERLQIMFMSMGEPLLNVRNLIGALRELKRRFPKAALLISTSGPAVDHGDRHRRTPVLGARIDRRGTKQAHPLRREAESEANRGNRRSVVLSNRTYTILQLLRA